MQELKYLHHFGDNIDIESVSKTGVYKLFHISNPDLIYIGSSSATGKKRNQCGFYRRFLGHLNKLKCRKHCSKKLQYIVDHNGIDGLRMHILELCTGKTQCREREQYYLDKLSPLLNNSKSSTSCHGVKHTDETKAKHSAIMAGIPLPEFVYEEIRRPVYQFTKNGKFIQSFKSIQEASNVTNIDRGTISHAAAGNRISAGGYLWRFDNKCEALKPKRLIRQYDLVTKQLVNEYETLGQVTRELNIISSNAIRNCFKGIQKQAYGYIWEDVHPGLSKAS